MVNKYPKNAGVKLGTYFNSNEFDCPCSNCQETLINSDLIDKLENVRESLGQPIIITSGYRCQQYQDDLKVRGYETAKGVSQHTLGNAADIKSNGRSGIRLNLEARKSGFKSVGIGSNWVHVDLRLDKIRVWYYTS